MAGSLLDNDDFSSIGTSGGGKSGSTVDKGNLVKIGVIIVCLGGAGLLFAYQSGVFDKKPVDSRTDEQITQEEEEFQMQERIRERLKERPEYQQGDA